MRKAWLLAGAVTASLATSGCVVVVGDDGDGKSWTAHTYAEGYQVVDRNGDYSRIGGDINLRGRIGGDLSLISGDVDADELEVGGDVSIAAGDVDFNGAVDGEVSIAGGDVTWLGSAGSDFSIAAGELTVRGDIAGEAAMAAASMHLDADFADEVIAQADEMLVEGRIAGPVKLVAAEEIKRRRMDDPEHGLIEISANLESGGDICARTVIFEPGARLGGELRIWAESEPIIPASMNASRVTFEYRDDRDCDDILD
ncbi:hypothetical protein [Maricaulis sp.]|uniref:hypothetical protein n=1 Tax=Maricaulis sp. TaxID=1486257 RepID=UPI0026111323|nr:hypothetical protein [Maricaulis sp.]